MLWNRNDSFFAIFKSENNRIKQRLPIFLYSIGAIYYYSSYINPIVGRSWYFYVAQRVINGESID